VVEHERVALPEGRTKAEETFDAAPDVKLVRWLPFGTGAELAV
jgi:hypothetical protein